MNHELAITQEEAAKRLGCSVRTVRALVADGRLMGLYLGRSQRYATRISTKSLDSLVATGGYMTREIRPESNPNFRIMGDG